MKTRDACADLDAPVLMKIVDEACRQIPPLWPLDSQVAVNPFLGQSEDRLADAAARLSRACGEGVVMPRQWYLERIKEGRITDENLADALAASSYDNKPADLDTLKRAAAQPQAVRSAVPTVSDLASEVSGTDWPGLVADRFGVWAGSYLDQGQALWLTNRHKGAWAAYRLYATHDVTPEIMGLSGFAAFVADAPDEPLQAMAHAVNRLGLEERGLSSYFLRLLHSLGGWAQFARCRLWEAELAGRTDHTLRDFLAIRLLWEQALHAHHEAAIAETWAKARAEYMVPAVASEDDIVDEILQEAFERSAQRKLAEKLAGPSAVALGQCRPQLQAAFCIDVRSEVFRRALEGVDPSIQTLGFAGFFGVSALHRRFASDVEEHRLPVLLNPSVASSATGPDDEVADRAARYSARVKRAWNRFKFAAVSSFAFVEAMGPVYVQKLLRDGLRLNSVNAPIEPKPRFDPPLDLEARISAAETVLRAMSLTGGFARIVLLAGHGASVVNNPHASALQCGACGGYSGEVNARLLADLLNQRDVRDGLRKRAIEIPDDTLFVAALHDTTTDAVKIYDRDQVSENHAGDIERVRAWLDASGKITRTERALRLPRAASADDVAKRAKDWAQVRPEWGLASCRAFIAAPRARTAGRDLEGGAFLHDYDWKQDSARGFPVLELIMTAPVVVASWISLQYYGSTVAPHTFGAGNKLLHNVVGGFGVVEGNGGLLRAGLPWQSVHDGDRYIHEPLRLSVAIEAPREAMAEILGRHPQVRALFDNRWLHLFALDEKGHMAWRYTGDLGWEEMVVRADVEPVLKAAS